MRYVIYGAGGIGGVIGARLHQHGHDVVLIARGAGFEAIRDRGLTLRTPEETLTQRIPAVAHPSAIAFTPDDVVLLTMKTQDTEPALRDLQAVAGPDVPVVCAQNGVENERLALRRFSRVYGAVVMMPATYLEPGVVLNHSAGMSGVVDCGVYPAGEDDLARRLCADLDASKVSSRPSPRIMRWKYAKLLNNLNNALVAACGPEARAPGIAAAARDEAIACYRAAGIDWASEDEMRERREQSGMRFAPIEGARRDGGSTWQSLVRGARSVETDWLNGEIALLGRLHGVPVPYNVALQLTANRMAREGRGAGTLEPAQLERLARELAGAGGPAAASEGRPPGLAHDGGTA